MVSISKLYSYYKWFGLGFAIVFFLVTTAGYKFLENRTNDLVPQAVQGTLDLRGYRFAEIGKLPLKGEWSFYWGHLLTPADFLDSKTPSAPQRIQVPGSWNARTFDGTKRGGEGYATYRLTVLIDDSSSPLAVHLPFIRTAYRVWINGVPMGGSGQVGTSPAESVPQVQARELYFANNGSSIDVVIQVSNYEHRLGGIWKTVYLGSAAVLGGDFRRSILLEMLLIGAMLAMGTHHLGLYVLRRKERGSLYFGFFCILIGVRAALIGEGIIYEFFEQLPWNAVLRIEYLCYYLGVPAAVLFVQALYPQEVHRSVARLSVGLGMAFSLAVLMLSSKYYTYTTPWYQALTIALSIYLLYSVTLAKLRKRDGATFALIGLIVYTITVVIDILFYNEWISIGEITSYGLIVLVIMTSFILSVKFAKAFSEVELLSRQMTEMNAGLEHKIRERTAELERTNSSLERTNEDLARLELSRRHLLSNISHDLGTPMTLIQGYVEALLDGVVSGGEQQHKYLRIIHNRITGLNRLINDLFQLSKLEARQLEFDMQLVPTEEFVRYFEDRYELEVSNAGFLFQSVVTRPAFPDEQQMLRLDVDRIDQVLTNLIYNAMKHTPKGGTIALHLIVDENSLVVQVQDNGMGIDPQDLPYIFDRFYKSDKSRNTSGDGSGLGLSIAKEIIDYHGGRIWAQSRFRQGACISFLLPLIKEK